MKRRDAATIFLFLFLGFAAEGGVVVERLLNGGTTLFWPLQVPFVLSMVLAFLAAQRAHRCNPAREPGFYCSKCNYDMRATLERCPECGGIKTAKYVAAPSLDELVSQIFGLAIVALVAASIIMMHVLVASVVASGGGGH